MASRNLNVGVMYSENTFASPINSSVSSGWPSKYSARMFAEFINNGLTLYNLKWSDISRNLDIMKATNLESGECLRNVPLDFLDVLCFFGFGDIGELQENDEEITGLVDILDKNPVTPTINPTSVVLSARKNKKKYLLDLNGFGISVPETKLAFSLDEAEEIGSEFIGKYGGFVVKPVNGYGGYLIDKFPGGDRSVLDKILVEQGEMLVQQYVDDILEFGERSVYIIDEKIEYTVLKETTEGILTNVTRNRSHVNRSLVNCTPEERELAFLARDAIAPNALVARADLIGRRDSPLICELTLSSVGLHNSLFENIENLPARAYLRLIDKLTS